MMHVKTGRITGMMSGMTDRTMLMMQGKTGRITTMTITTIITTADTDITTTITTGSKYWQQELS